MPSLNGQYDVDERIAALEAESKVRWENNAQEHARTYEAVARIEGKLTRLEKILMGLILLNMVSGGESGANVITKLLALFGG